MVFDRKMERIMAPSKRNASLIKLIEHVEFPKMRMEERVAYLKAFGRPESNKSA